MRSAPMGASSRSCRRTRPSSPASASPRRCFTFCRGALLNLMARVALVVIFGLVDPADQAVFQAIFGMILTVLIALEFNHSILSVLERKQSIVQVRTVVLIALLALVRKFIILDASKTEPLTLLGLAAAILALGAVHWLVRDQDRKDTVESPTTGAA